MGAEERQSDLDLKQALLPFERGARKYSFFRLIYLLDRLHKGAPQVGHLGPVASERVRLRGDTSLVFASSDIAGIAQVAYPDGAERTRVTTTFMALYGSTSPLPTYYVEQFAHNEYQGGPQPTREFLDVFHHRLLSLVYRAWVKYRFAVSYRGKGEDPFTKRMFCAVGVDGFRDAPTALHRFLHLRYAPLLAFKSRSVHGLEVVLKDLFGGIGVAVEQFIGQWIKLEKPLRNKLGVMNHQLGESLTIGRYVYDGSGRFNVVLGPLDYDDYLSFLPGGSRQPAMRGAIHAFTRGMYDVMLELHVKTESAPRFQLGSRRSGTLKRTAWLGGSSHQEFVITVPLEERQSGTSPEEDDDDRSEPPPL
jgi:type VI secretion system protein ImpH